MLKVWFKVKDDVHGLPLWIDNWSKIHEKER